VKPLFDQIEDVRSLAQIIVDTVREPLLVLDGDLNILVASTSFHRTFQIGLDDTQGRSLFALDDGAWDLPALHLLLEQSLADHAIVAGFEVAHDFPRIGPRIMLLHARKVLDEGNTPKMIVLGFEDVTGQRAIEREKDRLQKHTEELVQQKEILLEEMQHRIVNSLQIIASILMLKARAVTSEETRQHLQDAHRRVMSVAAVQQHLHSSGRADLIEVTPFLTKLCESLSGSMIGEDRPVVLNVVAGHGTLISADAVSVGLIVTELVINAVKHAFPEQSPSAEVVVCYEVNGTDWKLSVSDNGVGRPEGDAARVKGGLGTSLVSALAHQLDAQVTTTNSPGGTTVSVTHTAFTSLAPKAA
jgi:chemotaxis protein methyltransferase CheR